MGCRRRVDGVCGCRSWARRGRGTGEGTGWGWEVTGTQQDGLLVPSSVLLQGGASQACDSPVAMSFQATSTHPRVLDRARHPGAHHGVHHQQLRVPHPALAVSPLTSPHTPPSCWGSPQPGWGGSGIPAGDARSVCVTDGCVVPAPVRSDTCPACVPWPCGDSGAGGTAPPGWPAGQSAAFSSCPWRLVFWLVEFSQLRVDTPVGLAPMPPRKTALSPVCLAEARSTRRLHPCSAPEKTRPQPSLPSAS